MIEIFDTVISRLFPHACRVCGANVPSMNLGSACSDCWGATKIFCGDEILCPKCGNFLRDGKMASAGICHRCDSHDYDRAVACGAYEKALSATILVLKTKPYIPPIAKNIIRCRFENSDLTDSDVLIPIPLSKRRMRERGFNQAETLAAILTDGFGIPTDTDSLVRTVHTPVHRGGMDDKAREATVRKAFQVERADKIAGMRIVLIDDLMTSGSTAAHCASALKKNGAASVCVFTLARAL